MGKMKIAISLFLCFNIFITDSYSQDSFWMQTNGPLGGMIHSIVFNSHGDIFISTGDQGSNTGRNGIFRSLNNGHDWEHLNIDFTYGSDINCLEISDNDVIYAGSYFGGIYRSMDNGQTWEIMNGDLLWGEVIDDMTSIGDNTIIAGSRAGKIFLSKDLGSTWTLVLDKQASSTALEVGPDGKVYFGSLSHVYCSSDTCRTWQKINDFDYIGASGFAFHSFDTVFIASRGSKGISRSTDGGRSWVSCNNGFTSSVSVREIIVYDKNFVYVSTEENGIFCSYDFGQKWQPLNSGLSRSDILSINTRNKGTLYAGTDGGFYFSDDMGANWVGSNNGLISSIVRTIAFSPDQKIMYAGTSGGIYRSKDSGLAWTQSNQGLAAYDDIISLGINRNGTIFAGTFKSGIYRSSDGENWTEINNDLLHNRRINTILIDTIGNLFIGTSKWTSDGIGMLKSINNGNTWEQINNGLTDLVISASAINSKGTIFIGTDNHGIFYSNNSGNQWSQIQNEEIANSRIQALKIDENDNIYAVILEGGTKIYKSEDDGAIWNNVGQFNNTAFSFEIVKNQSAFLGVYKDIYRYDIDNNTWTWITTVTPQNLNNRVLSLIMADDGYMYAGTEGSGVFRGHEPMISSIEKDRLIDGNISTVYPNPFNLKTQIEFHLSSFDKIQLIIFNISGEKVRVLLDESKPAGTYNVVWDGKYDNMYDAANGVYFYQLKFGSYVESGKIILLK
jgi:photosystem II stability/assembly factor-like uncharacterized protein